MLSKSKTVSKLLAERGARESYVKAKLTQIIPSQIRAMRLREIWTQNRLGIEADMKQARISAMESPGEVNFSLETLVRIAAAFRVGLWVEFISHSELVRRENTFSQDNFKPIKLDEDGSFLEPNNLIPDHDYLMGMSPFGSQNGFAVLKGKSDTDVNHFSMGQNQIGAMRG